MNLDAGINLKPWTTLRPGTLPCAACGIAVSVPVDNYGDDSVQLFQVFGQAHGGRMELFQRDFAVTRCDQCTMILQSARDLLSAHPAVRQRIGAPEIAVHRLESALGALDLLGVTDATLIDRLTATGSDLTALMGALTYMGGSARWVTLPRDASLSDGIFERPSPLDRAAATPASSTRWAHVTPELRQELRNKAAGLLARRVERPVDVLAPSEGNDLSGCLLCGVYAVQTVRADADQVWTLMSADSAGIGGPHRPDSLDGVVCPTCDAAIDSAHGVGQSAMVLSVRAYLGLPAHIRSFEHVGGLVGWAALPADTPPNREPWGHIDLTEVRASVEALLRGMQPAAPTKHRPAMLSLRPVETSQQMVDVL